MQKLLIGRIASVVFVVEELKQKISESINWKNVDTGTGMGKSRR